VSRHPERRRCYHREHTAIVDALRDRDRDRDGAGQAMRTLGDSRTRHTPLTCSDRRARMSVMITAVSLRLSYLICECRCGAPGRRTAAAIQACIASGVALPQ
jgi:hypothetical protein